MTIPFRGGSRLFFFCRTGRLRHSIYQPCKNAHAEGGLAETPMLSMSERLIAQLLRLRQSLAIFSLPQLRHLPHAFIVPSMRETETNPRAKRPRCSWAATESVKAESGSVLPIKAFAASLTAIKCLKAMKFSSSESVSTWGRRRS